MTDIRQGIEKKINKYLTLHFIGDGLPEDECEQEAKYVVDLVIQWLAHARFARLSEDDELYRGIVHYADLSSPTNGRVMVDNLVHKAEDRLIQHYEAKITQLEATIKELSERHNRVLTEKLGRIAELEDRVNEKEIR